MIGRSDSRPRRAVFLYPADAENPIKHRRGPMHMPFVCRLPERRIRQQDIPDTADEISRKKQKYPLLIPVFVSMQNGYFRSHAFPAAQSIACILRILLMRWKGGISFEAMQTLIPYH